MNIKSLYPKTFNQLRKHYGTKPSEEVLTLRLKSRIMELAKDNGVKVTERNLHVTLSSIEEYFINQETKEADNEGQRSSKAENPK